MRTRSLLLFVVSFHFAFSDDADDADRWIVPTEPGPSNNFGANLVWSEGSTATLEWTSTLDSYVIDLYQQGLDPPSGSRVDTVFSKERAVSRMTVITNLYDHRSHQRWIWQQFAQVGRSDLRLQHDFLPGVLLLVESQRAGQDIALFQHHRRELFQLCIERHKYVE
jgi:hypothetical protein